MKDEIKEILEDVKRHLDYVEATKQCSIRDNEMKAMYDNITNLQKTKTNMEQELQELYLIKDNLQEENEKVHKDFDELSERYFFTKSRNEKAVEYNKKNIHSQKLNNILEGSDDNE